VDSKPQTDPDDTAAQASSSEKPRRVIKRYSNRKLYDTKDSRYVTLLQIAEMVRTGEEVQIIDNNSKEDLTEVTLAQIIYEEQKQKATTSRNVPLQTLKELIHQRTEKVLSDLREGPIGRLIPGAGKTELPKGAEAAGAEPAAVPESASVNANVKDANVKDAKDNGAEGKPSLVHQAKETFEDWQHKIDERVKTVLPSILPWQQLEHEIKRLNTRLEELEEKLKTLSNDRP
jgi:polyhydroxyalkanoate synthesis repressor PhaR